MKCIGIVYNGSHAITYDFTACEIINVTLFYNNLQSIQLKYVMEGLCEVSCKKQQSLSIE